MKNKKESVALSSVLASGFMTVMKFIVGIMTGSMGIISEAAHSALDLGAAGLTLFAVKVSDKPADDEHPYGHGKIESVSALIETGLLFLTSAWIIYEAIHRIITKNTEVEITWYAFAIIIISILIDISRSRALKKIAKETNSQALEADALHFSSDVWSSCVVLIGLILTALNIKGADTFAAIGVSLFVLFSGYKLGKKTIDVLIDTAPEGISDIIREMTSNVEGVISVDKIRVRPLGLLIYVEMEVGINRSFSSLKVSEIVKNIKEEIKLKINNVDILIHTKPVQLKDEKVADIVRTISSKHMFSVHSVVIDKFNEKKFISYDLELPGHLTVFQAHEICSKIEKEIQGELGQGYELNTHIDPYVIEETESKELEKGDREYIENKIKEYILDIPKINEAHNIVMRKVNGKIFITLHCYAKDNETIEETHQSSSLLKTIIKENIKGVGGVVIHVEPLNV